MTTCRARLAATTALGLALALPPALAAAQTPEEGEEIALDPILVLSAEEQGKQALGASTIAAEDIAKQPVSNDISEVVRKMPGVNLTGTTSTGQRGNQRQIDIRGMGPENTLILIDGKPVLSRNSVRMGRAGERDSRGDSNWVPAELIERIEVIRGPAAARYGSGAAGGVVNIITKRPETRTFSFSTHFNQPESGAEGAGQRANLLFATPLGETLSFRLTGNYNRTDADDPDINAAADTSCEGTATACLPAAGREGVVNKDASALFTWEVAPGQEIDFEFGYSRQGNIFAGDRQLTAVNDVLEELAGDGAETNSMTRRTFAITHRGTYDFGDSMSYLQWENTRNTRNIEGTAGGSEGAITSTEKGTIKLDNVTARSEWTLPLQYGSIDHSLTLGGEVRYEKMYDPISITRAVDSTTGEGIPGTDSDVADRDPGTDQITVGLYVEDNIYWGDRLILTPGLRVDWNDYYGSNVSPSLNASYKLSEDWTMKVGVARAFKSPNLFQLNPDYVYYTRGNGCPVAYPSLGAGCYVVGNEDLEAETSLNTEIGLAYSGANGVAATLTAFRNDYKNKIQAGNEPAGTFDTGAGTAQYFQWVNIPEAVVSGLEGSFSTPLGRDFAFSTNATYMIESKNKLDGQPLSLVPDYTVNASLDWFAREDLTVTASVTHYGRIQSPKLSSVTGAELSDPDDRAPYTIVNLGAVYDVNDRYRVSGGITNLFDKRILREGSTTDAGANTFNEPGRAFYVSLNATF